MTSRSVLLAGAAALLPGIGGAAVAGYAQEAVPGSFAPPAGPFVLTRTLYRSLADGKQVVVTRRFAIRILAEADGYRVEGDQIEATVDAPPMLAALAEMERNRIEGGLFPALLDRNGILRSSRPEFDPAVRAAAARQADRMINAAAMSPTDRQERASGLHQVAAAYGDSGWPAFLFNPGPDERRETRRLALPDGSAGEVEVLVRARGLMAGGLPREVERTVTTRLGGSSRVSREVWTIVPGSGE